MAEGEAGELIVFIGAGSGLSEAFSSRSANERLLGSVTPFAWAQVSQRSTL